MAERDCQVITEIFEVFEGSGLLPILFFLFYAEILRQVLNPFPFHYENDIFYNIMKTCLFRRFVLTVASVNGSDLRSYGGIT